MKPLLTSICSTAIAMPGMLAEYAAILQARQSLPSNPPFSSQEGNSGPIPSLTFDPVDQIVDVSPGSANQFIAPGPNDLRVPCLGLVCALSPRCYLLKVRTDTQQECSSEPWVYSTQWDQHHCSEYVLSQVKIMSVLAVSSGDWTQSSIQLR